jgi:arsenate reductase
MQEIGIDISGAVPKGVEGFLNALFDFVITVCDDANETCPLFTGQVGEHIHIGFDDPAKARGSDDEVLAEFRRVRDQIRERFEELYRTRIMPASRR